MALFVGDNSSTIPQSLKEIKHDGDMYDENGSYNGFNKIDTKKPLNHLKLDENTKVLRKDLFVFYQDDLLKFVLRGQNDNCNIISDGKLAILKLSNPAIFTYFIVCNKESLGLAYKAEYVQNLFRLNKKQIELLKNILSKENIFIGELLAAQNEINKEVIEKQEEEREIRMGYGF